ncbi:pyruvate oxidase [Erwinia sp. CPCC 100877]|nr:pyruvate oxidase [Erwinia sp. CPCC 100877]
MTETINAGIAMVKVLESWGVDHLYGIPGGSFNSTMDALYQERDTIKYIQVRHEEVGALAAAADAKLTGKIGVAFGSAGPGATHLINGLYDAQMDHVPVLALLGQVASTAMNYNSFQEFNENPMFADVSVYNRTVMTPESLPHIVDEAIKAAYQYKGVAVVTIPVDFGTKEIPLQEISTAKNHRKGLIMPEYEDIKKAVPLIEAAEKPVLYIGQGTRGAWPEIKAFSEHFSMPVVAAVLAKGIVPDAYKNFLGFAGRVATKPGNEVLAETDLIVFAGSDFPFAANFFNPTAKFIQIDIDSAKLGRRHKTDIAILGDAKEALKRMVDLGEARPADKWLHANQVNKENWVKWLKSFNERKDQPLRPEPVFKEIQRIAEEDAIFVTDVGNTTIHAIRLLDLNGRQKFTTSGWFATMGNGIPGGIAAQLSYPNQQVFTLSGDGGFAMVMQDIITQVKYQLPIINVVFSNDSFGFIEAEQEDTEQKKFGVFLQGADYGKAGEALGALGFTITDYSQLEPAFTAAKKSERPVVIDIKIQNARPLPVEELMLDPEKFSEAEIQAFKEKYEVHDMPTLKELITYALR